MMLLSIFLNIYSYHQRILLLTKNISHKSCHFLIKYILYCFPRSKNHYMYIHSLFCFLCYYKILHFLIHQCIILILLYV